MHDKLKSMNLLEKIYYFGYSLKKKHVLKNKKYLPFKVISIGNITVGGAGKTPAAIAVAEEAKKRGMKPVILTRGYKGRAKGPCFVNNGNGTVLGVGDAGDEPFLMSERLRDVPIVKCANRYEGGIFAIENLKPRVSDIDIPFLFILDDGFQHWLLYRNLDVVLIDGTNPFGNRRMIPSGRLREPINELKRADLFLITKSENKTVANELNRINPAASVYFSKYQINRVINTYGDAVSLEKLKGSKFYAFCGLANPDSFQKTVLSITGTELCGFKAYSDHYFYKKSDIIYLENQAKKLGCDYLITTEKDAVKLKVLEQPPNLLCVEVNLSIEQQFFDEVFSF